MRSEKDVAGWGNNVYISISSIVSKKDTPEYTLLTGRGN